MNWNQIKGCQKCYSVQLFSDVLCSVAMAHAGQELCPADLQELSRLLTLSLTQLLPSADWIRMISFCMLVTALTPLLHPPIASVSLPSHLMFSLSCFFLPLSSISHSVCSVHPVVVLATGIVWSCVRVGRAVTRCQSPSAPSMAGPPPGCAVTCSAALPLSGWRVPGGRWDRLLVYSWFISWLFWEIFRQVRRIYMQCPVQISACHVCFCVAVFCQVWSGSGDAFSSVSDPHWPALYWVSGSSETSSHAAVQEQMWPQSAHQYRQPWRSEVKDQSSLFHRKSNIQEDFPQLRFRFLNPLLCWTFLV